jgi:hypothetical protein
LLADAGDVAHCGRYGEKKRLVAQSGRPPGISRSAAQGLSASSLVPGGATWEILGLAAGENPSSWQARSINFAV